MPKPDKPSPRSILALARRGWPLRRIAEATGYSHEGIRKILTRAGYVAKKGWGR